MKWLRNLNSDSVTRCRLIALGFFIFLGLINGATGFLITIATILGFMYMPHNVQRKLVAILGVFGTIFAAVASSSAKNFSKDGEEEGYMNGYSGPGYYKNGWKVSGDDE